MTLMRVVILGMLALAACTGCAAATGPVPEDWREQYCERQGASYSSMSGSCIRRGGGV
jgi:hypothetical protein